LRRREDGTRTLETIQRYGHDLPSSVVALDPESGEVTLAGAVAEVEAAEVKCRILEAVSSASGPVTEEELRTLLEIRGERLSKGLHGLLGENRIGREGRGRKGDPYRYRLPEELSSAFPVAGAGRAEEYSLEMPTPPIFNTNGRQDSLPGFVTVPVAARVAADEDGGTLDPPSNGQAAEVQRVCPIHNVALDELLSGEWECYDCEVEARRPDW
jgi:hypothetical protein